MNDCVLVIDDNPDMRVILSMQLERAGFGVVTAEDGVAGLEALWAHSPCCVLLDLMMPRMDGFEFLTALRRHRRPVPPVYVVSQCDDIDTDERVRALGAEKLVSKYQALQRSFGAALQQWLGERQLAA